MVGYETTTIYQVYLKQKQKTLKKKGYGDIPLWESSPHGAEWVAWSHPTSWMELLR